MEMYHDNSGKYPDETEDQQFQQLFSTLPDPGPARITARVMHRVRRDHHSERTLSVKPRHIVWGLASSLAGVFIGFYLANFTMPLVDTTQYVSTSTDQTSSYIDPIEDMQDGWDQMIVDLLETVEEQ
ncbi:MAG: hypothetical protein P9M15_02610 [Candidatus Electryoneaceae bacterium]|nr:hypothetical protein [Candidatus Electryoneaceae bacterium]